MKTKRIIPIFFILILSLFPTIPFVESAGYGEENENLGQFTDDFENLDNVTVIDDLIRNATLDAIHLANLSTAKVFIDFDDYIEVDALNRLSQGDTFSNWTNMDRTDNNIYLYRDYGVDYFDDFVHEFELYVDSAPPSAGPLVLVMVTCYTDGLGDWIALRGASTDQIAIVVASTNDEAGYRIQMRESFAGSDENTLGAVEFDEDTIYYLRAIKEGTMWRASIFDDAARTNLLENVTLTLDADHKLRYHLPPQSPDFPTSKVHTGYINNFWMGDTGGGFETDGYFITDNYLNYTTGNSLTLLTNSTIPASTSLTVQFSNDNATWFDNHGNVGSTEIEADFFAIDLRDLNYSDIYSIYNFTGNTISTPILYQSRLITTNGTAGVGQGPTVIQNVTGAWVEYNATAISVITGILDDGFLNSTYFIDADSYEVSEVVGAPGWDIRWNYTNIPVMAICGWMNVFYSYDGNLAHVIEVQLYNWTSSSWDTIGLMVDTGGFVWSNSSMSQYPQNYVNEGLVMARAYHTSPGNINHDIKIEYIKLRVFIPFEDEVIVADADFFWVFIAIVLSIIVGLLMWLKYEHNNN